MTLRVGLIGCGNWGRNILRDLLSLGAEVHVAAPTEASRARALALGAARAVSTGAEIGAAIDGYVVATPSITHAAVVETLLASGRPIFVEKPLTTNLAAAQALVAAAGERIFVMDKWRYHPGIEALAAMAKSGDLGEILAIRSYRLGWGNSHPDADAAWILMPHDLSIVLEILGHLPAARAAWTPTPGRASSDIIAEFDDGGAPQVTIEVATSHPVILRSVVVVGSRRSAQLGGAYDDRITIADGVPDRERGAPYEKTVTNEMPLLRELEAFLAHLRGGPPPRSSAGEALMIVERIAAARKMAGLND